MRCKEAVSGNAEFLRHVGVDVRNWFHGCNSTAKERGLSFVVALTIWLVASGAWRYQFGFAE